MPGGNPSADPVASTDPRGMLRHPPFANCSQKLPIGRGTKALNPGGAGAKPPQAAPAPKLPSEARAASYNALKGLERFLRSTRIGTWGPPTHVGHGTGRSVSIDGEWKATARPSIPASPCT